MTQSTPPTKEHPLFKAGAVLLILANIICGLFAVLAEERIGSKNVDFAISFAFLGIVTIGIFVLAFIDNATRSEQDDWEPPH